MGPSSPPPSMLCPAQLASMLLMHVLFIGSLVQITLCTSALHLCGGVWGRATHRSVQCIPQLDTVHIRPAWFGVWQAVVSPSRHGIVVPCGVPFEARLVWSTF